MKTFKAIFTAAILALALSVPAYAGDILTPGFTSPAPGPEQAPGDIQTPGATATAPGDISSPAFADILLALMSMF